MRQSLQIYKVQARFIANQTKCNKFAKEGLLSINARR